MARQKLCVRTLALILIPPLLIIALLVGAGGSKALLLTPGTERFVTSNQPLNRSLRWIPVGREMEDQENPILSFGEDIREATPPQGTNGPNPAFSASNYNPCANQSVQFDALNTAGTTYAWDFGDGSQANDPTRSVTHSYMGAGAYNVTLTVTSSSGSATSSKQVFVTNCVPMGGSQANWFFGFFGELHFNTGEPLPGDAALTHNTIFTSEASITQSDSSGNLLFYSDGKLVWNNQHVQVNGGLNVGDPPVLTGGDHPVQALSVPDPADLNPDPPSSFYLISMRGYTCPSPSSTCTDGNFGFTKVSVSGSNLTLSSVNTPIAPPAGADTNIAEMVTAVPGCGNNYWIIVHGSILDASDEFRHALFVYPLTAAGIGVAKVYPSGGPALFGQLKASPDGTKVAYGTGDNRSEETDNKGFSHVLDFNRSTGVPSNPRVIGRYAYGVSFSANSQLLYTTETDPISHSEKIFQYDLKNNLSKKLVADVPAAYSALQLGPDNKIYVALNGNNHLAVINFPDERNTGSSPNACGYSFDGPFLNIPSSDTSVMSGFGLPNMIDARKVSPSTADCCPTIALFPAAGALPGAVVNTSYSQTFTATGGIGPYTFTVSSGTLPPGMVLDGDGTLSGNPVTPGTYNFTVTAADMNGCLGVGQYQIIVSCPVITLNPAAGALPGAVVNTSYSQNFTATGGIGPYTFTVSSGSLPPGMVLDGAGTLQGTPVTPGTYNFTVTAADMNGCLGVGQYQIVVSCPVITLNPAAGALPGAVVNTSYSQNFTATGGIGPYTFTVSSGSLPPGMVLDGAGTLQGTPVTPGTYNFTVTAADVNGCLGVGQYQIVVSCPVITLNPAAGALPGAVVNTPYSQTFTASAGCTSSFTYSVTSGALPPGLTLGANGVLSGTPIETGDFSFNVTATDSCGCSQTQSYTLKVQSEENKVQTKVLVISAFRQNGPNGAGDEFVEIFNPSTAPVTVSSLPGNPGEDDVGVFSSDGKGTASDAITLRCLIPGTTVIKGRGWFLCGGSTYSLGNLGVNGGPLHSEPDAQILGDIPNDAGLVLLKFSTAPSVTVSSSMGFLSGGNPAMVFDSVGFGPYDNSAPAGAEPSLAFKYCEGTCLQPVGDASTITPPPTGCPTTVDQAGAAFPVQSGGVVGSVPVQVPLCYGESGQYQIGRRRSAQQFNSGTGSLHRDTDNNADDFILVSPNPSTANVGLAITGRSGITSVLGAAGPHSTKSPPIVGQGIYTGAAFDLGNANQLEPANAERRYSVDPNILNANNNPLGTFLLRIRFTNNGNAAVSGVRFRIDDITGLCGGQTGAYGPPGSLVGSTSETATQEARNLRLGAPSCQGEGSDNGLFTAVLKGVNHNAEFISQPSDGTVFFVNGSSLEDVPSADPPLSPLGGGGNNSYVINSNLSPTAVGDGVSGGPGSFAVAQPNVGNTSSSTRVLRVAFKFGVVKAGRFKLLIGREAFGPAPVN